MTIVSVVIPSHQRREALRRALRAFCEQTAAPRPHSPSDSLVGPTLLLATSPTTVCGPALL